MAASLREQIMVDVKTTLDAISQLNGYNNNIGLVTRAVGNDIAQGSIPVLYIEQGDEMAMSAGENNTPMNVVTRVLTVRVGIIHRLAADVVADTALNSIQQDIYKAMMVDHTRGSLAIDTLPRKATGALELEAVVDGALKLIEFDVLYRHNWQDESVAA